MLRAVILILIAAMLAADLSAQQPAPTPPDVAGWAIAHQASIPESARPSYRYLWIPPYMIPQQEGRGWDERHIAAALSYAINETASQTGVIIQPRIIANGWMMAVYLPNYASATKVSASGNGRTEIQTLIDVWDGIAAEDPYFHLPKEISGINGAVQSPAIDSLWAKTLVQLSSSPSLVYRADWFLERILHTRYYQFAQFGKTQQDVYSSIGVDEKLVQQLDGDRRSARFVSGITKSPRRIDQFQGLAGRNGTGVVFQTWDLKRDSVRVNQHPMFQLLRFNPDGGEAIFEKPNGLHGFLVFDARRELQVEVPPDIARDDVPHPNFNLVVPSISCIRCHGKNGGFQDAPNDVQRILGAGFDIFGDIQGEGTAEDVVLRLAGLYAGDFSRRIEIGRDDYDLAVRRATIMPHQPQGMGVQETSALVGAIYSRYVFDDVDAERACLELGIDVGENAIEALRAAIPSETPDNASLIGLKSGISVRRKDFEQSYPSMLVRRMIQKEKENEGNRK